MEKTKFLEEFENIKQLVDSAIYAPNKSEAKNYINKLNFYGYSIVGNTRNIFSSLVSYVDNASGRVSDKERKISFVQQELYKLEWHGVEKDN